MHHDPTAQKPHPLLQPRLHKLLPTHTRSVEIQPDHIRLRRLRQLSAFPLPHVCDCPRASVRSGQFVAEESFIDADARRGGYDASLADPAAQTLADMSCPFHKCSAGGDYGADRRTQAFAEAHRHAVKARTIFL